MRSELNQLFFNITHIYLQGVAEKFLVWPRRDLKFLFSHLEVGWTKNFSAPHITESFEQYLFNELWNQIVRVICCSIVVHKLFSQIINILMSLILIVYPINVVLCCIKAKCNIYYAMLKACCYLIAISLTNIQTSSIL